MPSGYFTQSAVVLFERAPSLTESLEYYDAHGLLPLDVYSNVRVLNIAEAPGWLVMDTVGMEQLGVCDHEVCVPVDTFDGREVVNFIRNATVYVFQKGPVIRDGDTMNGPGGINWRARAFEESLGPPPREVLRWRPAQGVEPPACLVLPKS